MSLEDRFDPVGPGVELVSNVLLLAIPVTND